MIRKMIDFHSLISSYRKKDLDTIDMLLAIKGLCMLPHLDAISYKINRTSDSFSELENGTWMLEFSLDRNKGDIYTDFELFVSDMVPFHAFYSFNEKTNLTLDKDTWIPIVCSMYNLPIKLQFIFEQKPEKVELSYKSYLLQCALRENLMWQDILVDNVRYRDGCATVWNQPRSI